MASPNLTTDVTAKMWISEVVPDWPAQSTILEDGSSQSYYPVDKKLREWKVSWENMSASDFTSLNNFYDARRGSYEKCYLNDPISGTNDIPVKFKPGSYVIEPGFGSVRTVRAVLQEVI